MKVRIRQIRLRVETSRGPYGADIILETGLNVIWADNTKGKSTCLQGFLYALGLERMLSPRREIPLPYVMTTHINDPQTGERHSVLESSVWVELENGAGEAITVRRSVIGTADRKLVSVFKGPLLSQPQKYYPQNDYFVHDPGSAQREAGFHHFLAEFIGWDLPTVRRYNDGETKLYLETIFPLLYVEQKAGWSSVPAAFPGYFQIRDVGRRAVEFILNLETFDLDFKRQQLEIDLATNKSAWTAKREEILSIATLINARLEGVGIAPIISPEELERAHLIIAHQDQWQPLEERTSFLRSRLTELNSSDIPQVEDTASEAELEVEQLTLEVAEQNARRSTLFRARQVEVSQRDSVARRLAALEEDLQKNVDAQKLKNLGSTMSSAFAAEHCPTCSQPISDTLLAQQVESEIMPIDDNIRYLQAQRELFRRMQDQVERRIATLGQQLASATTELNNTSARLRALKSDLIAPSNSPSIAAIEERIRLETQIQILDDTQQRFEFKKDELSVLAAQHADILERRNRLPEDRLTEGDRKKLTHLTQSIREQTKIYGLSTFPATEIDISEESYRPQKEGFEIGFELSASDAIRLKWAYQLALLELARTENTNHPEFLIFDEPRQQSTARISFRELLERAAIAKSFDQQVIFATSEDRERLEEFLKDLDCNFLAFDGFIIKRLADKA